MIRKAGPFHGFRAQEHRIRFDAPAGRPATGRRKGRLAAASLALLVSLTSLPPLHAGGGDLIWTASADTAGGFDSSLAIATGNDRVFTAGYATAAAGDTDFAIRAHDSATGRALWTHLFDLAGGADAATGVVSTGGLVIAAGSAEKAPGDSDFVVRAVSGATGELVWEDRLDRAGGRDVAVAVAATVGQVFAAGFATHADGHRDVLIRSYEAKTGTLIWEREVDILGARDQVTLGALTVAGGNVFVGGFGTTAAGDRDGLVFALDAQTGALAWQDQFGSSGNDIAEAVAARWGRLFVAGFRSEPDFSARFLLRAYDAQTGVLLWENETPTGPFGFDIGYSLIPSGGHVYAAGVGTLPDGRSGFFVRAYDSATGVVSWEDLVDHGGSSGVAVAITAQRDRIIAAGVGGPRCGAALASDCDFITRSYDGGNGRLLWEDVGDLAGSYDQANAMVLQGQKVFLAGLGYSSSGNADAVVRVLEAD